MSFKTKRNRPMLMKNRTYYTLKTLKKENKSERF